MRINCFPLLLQSEARPVVEENLSASAGPSVLSSSQKSVPPQEAGPPAYVSLLTEPFIPPTALTRPSGLPSNPTFAPPTNPRAEFQLTPETLRFLGSTFERFMAQIRDVQLAYTATTLRGELQKQEFKRQQDKCREMLSLVSQLHGARRNEAKARFARVQDNQKALLARLERILQSLTKKASPELSEHETKWFEELKRMKAEVAGTSKHDQNSFEVRAALGRHFVHPLERVAGTNVMELR